jgi:hypothetical protein
MRPSFAKLPPPIKQRAQGRPGARCTRGLMCKMHKANAHEHTGSAETLRPSPRNGFTAYFVLSSVTGLSCHRRPQEALASWKLDTSVGVSGPHDFAVRNSRARLARCRVHRIPHPTFVTIAKRPSLIGAGWRELVALICPTAKAKYFSQTGWTTHPDGQVVPRVADDEKPRHYSMKRAAVMLRPSLLEGSVVTACRPSCSSCQFRPRSSS